MPAPVKEMFDIEGLESISMKRYNFQFMKGVVFGWDDLIPQLLTIIKKYYSPEEELTEAAPARRMTMDALGRTKDAIPEMSDLLDE